MLLLDDRVGSRDMRGALERQGLQVDLVRMDSCDVAFVGRGIGDEPITIGIELKRIKETDGTRADLIASLRSGRLAGHQLGGMQAYDRAWLITEGLWRGNDEGVLEIYQHGGWAPVHSGKSTLLMRDVEAQILSITTRGGLHYWHCPTSRDTIRFVTTLYHWWTAKALDEHRSHQVIYLPPPDRAVFIEPSAFVKMIYAGVKGLGYEKALAVEAHFGGSFKRLYEASVKELRTITGVGTTLADRIHTVLHSDSAAAAA